MTMGAVLDINSKPRLLLCLAFFLIVAYIPGIVGATVPTGWFYLFVTMPIIVYFCEIELNIYNFIGFLFLIYAATSLIWVFNIQISLFFVFQLLALSCVFILGQNLNSLTQVFKGLAIGLGISDLIAIGQKYFEFKLVFFEYYTAAGLFVNPNIFSEVSAVILVSLVVLKLWKLVPLAIPGLVLSPSRTALVALALCGFIWICTKNKLVALITLGIAILVAFVISQYGFRWSSVFERYYLWADTIQGFKFFGNGVGTFETLYPWNATHIDTLIARPRFAHNDLLQLVFEFGIGSCLVIYLLFRILILNRFESYILYAVGIISMVSFPLHVPVLAFIGVLVAGYLTRFDTNRSLWDNSRSTLYSRA